jgi:opacity protein-like surface antigen
MRFALFLLLAGSAFAQFSVGVKGGIPINDFIDQIQSPRTTFFSTETKRYVVGPTVEFQGPFGLSVEADALYRRVGYDYRVLGVDTSLTEHTRTNYWQFPILAKFAFMPGPIKPFVDGGVNIQHISGIRETTTFFAIPLGSTTTTSGTAQDLNSATNVGATFGFGLQFRLSRLRIEPEFRYTRWGTEAFRDPARTILTTNLNQGDFLLGIRF